MFYKLTKVGDVRISVQYVLNAGEYGASYRKVLQTTHSRCCMYMVGAFLFNSWRLGYPYRECIICTHIVIVYRRCVNLFVSVWSTCKIVSVVVTYESEGRFVRYIGATSTVKTVYVKLIITQGHKMDM